MRLLKATTGELADSTQYNNVIECSLYVSSYLNVCVHMNSSCDCETD